MRHGSTTPRSILVTSFNQLSAGSHLASTVNSHCAHTPTPLLATPYSLPLAASSHPNHEHVWHIHSTKPYAYFKITT
ncbi:hypothetical protein GQ44DRAFT_371057 [Phaeosphaeriaceae sp. PMI808]|nr:hypothetical protein GQ44DRAFT_371057 [Phaeosphaeriaceae sp. PMI808]